MPADPVGFPGNCLEIGGDHFGHKVGELGLVAPTELPVGLARIAQEHIDFRGTEIARIDADQNFSAYAIDTRFIGA